MRPSPTTLTGSTVTFDRAGRRLLAIEPDAIAVVDLARNTTRRIAHAGARVVAGFDDQIWLATRDDELVRLDYSGAVIGAPRALPFAATPMLAVATCGPAAAVWPSSPALALLDDFGELASTALPDAELAVPTGGRRHALVRAARVLLPSGQHAQLPPGTAPIAGLTSPDGKWLLVLARDRQLTVITLASGQLAQRCTLPAGAVRIAAQRLAAACLVEPDALVLVDLRTGRELGNTSLPCEPRDLAIDPVGGKLVTRSSDDDSLEVHVLADLLARAPVAVAMPAAVAVEEPEVPVLPTLPAPVEVISPWTPIACPVLRALEPRVRRAAVDRSLALAQLELELRRVQLDALAAIADGWDSRRIGYGNEGRHPYELEVAAILGLSNGHASDHIAAAREATSAHEQRIALDPHWRDADTPLGRLMLEHDLSARAIDILVVIAAVSLWGETARLFGILANDASRAPVDELVVHQLLARRYNRHDLAAELDPRAPLVRLGLVHISGRRARPFAELTIDPVILDLLRATPPELGDATTLRGADRQLDELAIPRDVIDAALAALSTEAAPARIAVRGRAGSGRKTLLATLAAEAGRDLALIDALALPRTAEAFVVDLRIALRRAHLAGHIPCLAHLDELTFEERSARDVAAETLRLHPGPLAVVLAAETPSPFPAGHIAIDLPTLAETFRLAVWRSAAAHLPDLRTEELAARYRIGPGLIRRAIAAARPPDPTATIDAFIRQTRDTRLSQYARRVERLASWASVVLPPDILDSLRELVARVRHSRTVYDTWGMSRIMATSRGLTALFQGPPGTGKTLVAGVIARELGLDLYQVDLSKVMSKWIGETERNLSTIFDAAEDGQVVLLFDEADSLFAKRTEVRSSNDRYANLEVNYLLQRLDAFEGIAILTTNSGTSIDQAFKRRMSFRLSFPFPDEDTREQLWRAHLPADLPIAGPLALDALARKYQLAGGYIRNACLRAAFLAAQEETALHQRHLERAVTLEYAELGKLSSSGAID